jgi:hypothetical protein
MPFAVAPAIVPDGGDVEDPEGDTDVDTAESDEEGGSDGNLFCLNRCVRWPVPGWASGTARQPESCPARPPATPPPTER